MKTPMQFDDIYRLVLDIFPDAELCEDLEGQLVVYTGLECASSDGFYAPMKPIDSWEDQGSNYEN